MLNTTKLTLFIFLAVAMHAKAQTIEIVPQINYTFGGKIYGQFGELNIQDSESYGISLDIVKDDVSFQLEYFYQPTTAEYREYLTQDVDEADLRINWYQIGVRKRFATDETVVPFGGASIGLTDFKLDSSPDYDEIALSFALQAGANIYLSENIGLRFHGRLLMPVQFNGFGFYAGTGGSGAAASAGTYFVQGDVGAGVIIRLAK